MSLIIDPYRFGTTFDPLTAITWHAAFWAADPGWSNPGDGNSITTWRDGSGNGRTLSDTGGTKAKYYSSVAGLNNQPANYFTNGGLSATISLSQPDSIVMILKQDSTTLSGPYFERPTWAGGSVTQRYWGGDTSTGSYMGSGATNYTTGHLSDTNTHLTVVHFNGTSSWAERDGTRSANGDAGTTGYDKLVVAYLNASTFFKGYIAFIGLYSGDVTSDGQWSAFETWAASTYGLTIS